jgi:hypothetical protein
MGTMLSAFCGFMWFILGLRLAPIELKLAQIGDQCERFQEWKVEAQKNIIEIQIDHRILKKKLSMANIKQMDQEKGS